MSIKLSRSIEYLDTTIAEFQALLAELDGTCFQIPQVAPARIDVAVLTRPEPRPEPIEIEMKTGKGYGWLAAAINKAMAGKDDYTDMGGTELRKRMGSQMLYKEKVYRFEAEELISGAALSGGLSGKEIKGAQKAAVQFKEDRAARKTEKEMAELMASVKKASDLTPGLLGKVATPEEREAQCYPGSAESSWEEPEGSAVSHEASLGGFGADVEIDADSLERSLNMNIQAMEFSIPFKLRGVLCEIGVQLGAKVTAKGSLDVSSKNPIQSMGLSIEGEVFLKENLAGLSLKQVVRLTGKAPLSLQLHDDGVWEMQRKDSIQIELSSALSLGFSAGDLERSVEASTDAIIVGWIHLGAWTKGCGLEYLKWQSSGVIEGLWSDLGRQIDSAVKTIDDLLEEGSNALSPEDGQTSTYNMVHHTDW